MKSLGARTSRCVQIPDSPVIYREELTRAVKDCGLVLITGGLGPTSDDLTRETAARVAGVKLEYQASVWEGLKKRYPGRRISPINKRQAFIPEGFRLIENPYGSAPGFAGRINGTLVVALPGPPKELEPVFKEQVVPLLARELNARIDDELKATVMMVPESLLEEGLRKHRLGKVVWGTRIAEDRILVNLRGGTAEERRKAFQGLELEFTPVLVRKDDVRPSLLLLQALESRDLHLAVAESCTGGLLGKLITDIPGSSKVFWGGLVVYSNEAKEELLGLDPDCISRHGAVSGEVASAMAEGVLKKTGCKAVALAVTGVAGPEGGSPEKPVGTVWISALASPAESMCREFNFYGTRNLIRQRTAVAAFLMAESLVLKRSFPLGSKKLDRSGN